MMGVIRYRRVTEDWRKKQYDFSDLSVGMTLMNSERRPRSVDALPSSLGWTSFAIERLGEPGCETCRCSSAPLSRFPFAGQGIEEQPDHHNAKHSLKLADRLAAVVIGTISPNPSVVMVTALK